MPWSMQYWPGPQLPGKQGVLPDRSGAPQLGRERAVCSEHGSQRPIALPASRTHTSRAPQPSSLVQPGRHSPLAPERSSQN
jgi:hypothetical protein